MNTDKNFFICVHSCSSVASPSSVYFDQANFDLRCEWGASGLDAAGNGVDVIIIVDVLSFSTAVDIAVSKRASV